MGKDITYETSLETDDFAQSQIENKSWWIHNSLLPKIAIYSIINADLS